MLLAIDFDNTNVVFAAYDGAIHKGVRRCADDPRPVEAATVAGVVPRARHTASVRLPRVTIRPTGKVIGTSTIPATRPGIFWEYSGMIEGLATRTSREFGASMMVAASGGVDAPCAGASDVIDRTERELTMRGRLDVCRRNRAA